MTTKDEALKMAIEALENIHNSVGLRDYEDDALQACKLALEQPAEPRLVSYALDGSTCTLNIDGEEIYFNCQQPAQVTRLEVIDNNGRSYVNMGVDKLEFSYQDEGRTLKLFTNGAGTFL